MEDYTQFSVTFSGPSDHDTILIRIPNSIENQLEEVMKLAGSYPSSFKFYRSVHIERVTAGTIWRKNWEKNAK